MAKDTGKGKCQNTYFDLFKDKNQNSTIHCKSHTAVTLVTDKAHGPIVLLKYTKIWI